MWTMCIVSSAEFMNNMLRKKLFQVIIYKELICTCTRSFAKSMLFTLLGWLDINEWPPFCLVAFHIIVDREVQNNHFTWYNIIFTKHLFCWWIRASMRCFKFWNFTWSPQFDASRFDNDYLLDDLSMPLTWIAGVLACDERGYKFKAGMPTYLRNFLFY